MKESDWQVKDRAEIIDLIVKNCSVGTLEPSVERRIRGKLESMSPVELWNHIFTRYNGTLYEEERGAVVDEAELRRRERLLEKKLEREKPAKIHVNMPVVQHLGTVSTPIEEADIAIYGKSCVKKTFNYGNQLVVVMEDASMTKKLRRWVTKHYPTVNVTIIGEETNA